MTERKFLAKCDIVLKHLKDSGKGLANESLVKFTEDQNLTKDIQGIYRYMNSRGHLELYDDFGELNDNGKSFALFNTYVSEYDKTNPDMPLITKGVTGEEFHGDLNDREILIHAVNHFKKKPNWDFVSRIFRNKSLSSERELIQAVLLTSPLFESQQTGSYPSFKLSPQTTKDIFSNSIESVVDKSLEKPTSQPTPLFQYNDHSTSVGGDMIGSGNQHSSFRESPISQSVTTTPSKKDKNNGAAWYSKPLFTHIIWPVVAGLIIAYFIFVFKWNK